MRYQLFDLDHPYPAMGGAPSDHDFCHVYDNEQLVPPHPLVGGPDIPKLVKVGTRAECAAWIALHD